MGSTAKLLGLFTFCQWRTRRLDPSRRAISILPAPASVQYRFRDIQSTASPSGNIKPYSITSSWLEPFRNARDIAFDFVSVQ